MPDLHARMAWKADVQSTMEEARTVPPGEFDAPFWSVADRQLAGRGRRGHEWTSPRGNLNATAAFTTHCPAERLSALCLVAGVAVFDAVLAVSPTAAPALVLKWPNDVMVGPAKLGGVLVETEFLATATSYIGFGVNLVEVAREDRKTAALTGVTADRLLVALDQSLRGALAQWRENDYRAPIDEWTARGPKPGETITRGAGTPVGLYMGLDTDGNLLAQTPDGPRRLSIDDVT